MPEKFLAVDLGASSGRGICGTFDGECFTLKEVHRFSNDPVSVCGSFYWDTLRLFHEIKNSLLSAVADGDALTVGIDTWGVDYAYLDANGALFSPQYHYRDGRTEGMEREFFSKMPYP